MSRNLDISEQKLRCFQSFNLRLRSWRMKSRQLGQLETCGPHMVALILQKSFVYKFFIFFRIFIPFLTGSNLEVSRKGKSPWKHPRGGCFKGQQAQSNTGYHAGHASRPSSTYHTSGLSVLKSIPEQSPSIQLVMHLVSENPTLTFPSVSLALSQLNFQV